MEGSNKHAAVREIPGFYYDEEKKKYFRITKDHPKKSFGKDVKKQKQVEKQQQKEQDSIQKKFLPGFKILMNQKVRPTSTSKLQRHLNKANLRCFDIERDGKFSKLDYSYTGLDKVGITHIVPNVSQDKIVVVSKVKGSIQSLVQVYDISHSVKKGCFVLGSVFDVLIAHCTSISFSPYKDSFDQLIISTIGEDDCLSVAQNVFMTAECLVHFRSTEMKKGETIWSSCFIANPFTDKGKALGTSSGILLTGPNCQHVSSRFVKTNKSDVLALECSHKNQHLYTGSRDRTVRCFDLRQLQSVSSTKAKQSVDNLKLLNDDFHLLVSTMAGHIELWDTRTWKPVLSYLGHNNSHSMLSLHVDGNEDFVACVGEDCVTRIWDLRTTELFRKIPSLKMNNDDAVMPAFMFGAHFANLQGANGFLYGIEDQIYFNTLKYGI